MDERRYVSRVRIKRDAKLIVGPDMPLVSCTVHDLTASGACLSIASTDPLPPTFELTFEHGRSRRPCRVVWRSATRVGVAFGKPAE